MNRLKLFSVIVIVTCSLISCKKNAIDPSSGSQQQANSRAANAATVNKFMTEIDLSVPGWSEYNACNGDYIHVVKGIWHIDQTFSINGSRLTLQSHSNTSSYKLVDENTGIAYTGSYVSNDMYNTNIIIGQPAEFSGTLKILLTTPGNDNNGKYIVDYHVTINANGVITVNYTNQRAGCQ